LNRKYIPQSGRLNPDVTGLIQSDILTNMFFGGFDKGESHFYSAAEVLEGDWEFNYAMLCTWTNRLE